MARLSCARSPNQIAVSRSARSRSGRLAASIARRRGSASISGPHQPSRPVTDRSRSRLLRPARAPTSRPRLVALSGDSSSICSNTLS
jgi:hypothetical protein